MPQMNGKFLFETIMECIDNNIGEGERKSSRDAALRAIVKATTYTIKDIKAYFLLTTGDRLGWYYNQRRLYYAFKQIVKDCEKPIGTIANFYGYSDCASFNHAFKQAFSVSPTKARENPELVKDNRLVYSDFQQPETEHTVHDNSLKMKINMAYLHDYEEYGTEEFGFSPSLSNEIASIAAQLGVSVYRLMDKCFDAVIDTQYEPDYLSPEVETAIDLDINSSNELEQICRYYDCKYYELNSSMVDYYRQNAGKDDEE